MRADSPLADLAAADAVRERGVGARPSPRLASRRSITIHGAGSGYVC